RTRRRRPVKTGAPESHGVPVGRVLGNRARDDSPGLPLERSELAGVVRAAVAELAGRQRQALELHQFHDHTYAEVAAEMDMTPKAAKSLLYRARNQLREMLQHLSNSGD
ncbi:MAG: RNA polymerase sigma factor, partial [Gemmataceae bacterium]